MHSRSTTGCTCVMYVNVNVLLPFEEEEKHIQFPWEEIWKRERVKKEKNFFTFCLLRINNALLDNINLLHLMRKYFFLFFYLFIPHLCLFVQWEKKWIWVAKMEKCWKKASQPTILYPKSASKTSQFWSWKYTSLTPLLLHFLL